MNNYVSYPSIRSPKPSHTITTDIVNNNNTTLPHKHNLSAQQNEGKVLSPIRPSTSAESSIVPPRSPRKSTAIQTSTTPEYATKRSSPLRASASTSTSTSTYTGLSSPAKTPSKYQPPSPYNNLDRSSNDTKATPPPPAPPAPPPPLAPRVSIATEKPLTFSPVRDIPNAFLTKRLQPKYAALKSIKESQLAPFLGPNIAITDKVSFGILGAK